VSCGSHANLVRAVEGHAPALAGVGGVRPSTQSDVLPPRAHVLGLRRSGTAGLPTHNFGAAMAWLITVTCSPRPSCSAGPTGQTGTGGGAATTGADTGRSRADCSAPKRRFRATAQHPLLRLVTVPGYRPNARDNTAQSRAERTREQPPGARRCARGSSESVFTRSKPSMAFARLRTSGSKKAGSRWLGDEDDESDVAATDDSEPFEVECRPGAVPHEMLEGLAIGTHFGA